MKVGFFKTALVLVISVAGLGVLAWGQSAAGADAGCGATGTEVVARHWDVVLGRGWEWVRSCAHPEWPMRAVAVDAKEGAMAFQAERLVVTTGRFAGPVETAGPLLVHAGETVRLWSQAAMVRIEMSGVAE